MTLEYPCRATLLLKDGDDTRITFTVGHPLTGYRLQDIRLRLTPAEFVDPRVREWLLEVVLPRRASAGEAVHIELGG